MSRFENLRRDEISYFSNYEWFPDWKNFLTSDYWKSWRTKIESFKNEKDLVFYTQRLGEIADFIRRCKKYGVKEGENADLLIRRKEIELENLSEEAWKKEYRFADTKIREMSVQEINQSFGEIDEAIFKNEVVKRLDKPVSYGELVKENLETEVKKLTSLLAELRRNDKNLNERQKKNRNSIVQSLEKQLIQSKASLSIPNNTTNNEKNEKPRPILPIVGGIGIIGLLISLVAYKNYKSKKPSITLSTS